MNPLKITGLCLAGGAAAAGAAYASVGNLLYEFFFTRRAPKHAAFFFGGGGEEQEPFAGFTRFYRENRHPVAKQTPKGIRLHADAFFAPEPSGVWVLCPHGYIATAETNGGNVKMLLSWGFNVLCPHMRGHGESETGSITMGWLDRLDMLQWISYLNEEYGRPPLVLFGGSMGAATVLMTTGEALPENVLCAVADSGFTCVWDVAFSAAVQLLPLPKAVIRAGMESLRTATRLRAGYDMKTASALEQVKRSHTPTLFLHGDQDKIVPPSMLSVLYDAASCEKEKRMFHGTGHVEAGVQLPEEYWGTVKAFLGRYVPIKGSMEEPR